MKERLIIENFVGIKNIDIEPKAITILIGKQATGKSICAKLLYFFKTFYSELQNAIENDESKHDLNSKMNEKFIQYFPQQSWGDAKFYIRYEINDWYISVENKGKQTKIIINYSETFNGLLSKCRKIYKKTVNEKVKDPDEFFDTHLKWKARENLISCVNDKLGSVSTYNQIFVPAGRSFFANLQRSIFSFLSSNKALDPFLVEFGSFYERVKSYPRMEKAKTKTEKDAIDKIDLLIKKILVGSYHKEKGKDFIVLDDGRKINVSNASSGQQEMLPLAILLKFIHFSKYIGGGCTVYIEEPEAHLFPTAQKIIVELISTVYNTSRGSIQFFITTHSPYILTSFNNLIQAGLIRKNSKEETKQNLWNIVEDEKILDPDLLIAYSLKNGNSSSLIDNYNLISTNIIDEVSNEIAIEFDKLMEI
jgi:predicted ATPase